MTPRQADRVIRAGVPVRVWFPRYGETGELLFVRRDRWNIYSADGGSFDRGDCKLSAGETLYPAKGTQ